MKHPNYFTLLTIFIVILFSCKNKYYYTIGKESEKTLRAETDSAAYVQVFREYTILRKLFTDLVASGAESASDHIPTHFTLFNNDHVDITSSVNFPDKEKLERFIIDMTSKMPNKYKKEKEKTTTSSK